MCSWEGRQHLEGVDDRLDVRLDGFMGKLGAGQSAHALQSQVAQVGLSVLQELAQLVTGSHQQVGLAAQHKSKTLTALLKLSGSLDHERAYQRATVKTSRNLISRYNINHDNKNYSQKQ